ncbi:MAG: hypothetical protein V9E86_00005, partial [Nitrosomonas sp.]
EMEKAVNLFFDETEDMIRISNSSFDPTLKMKLTSSSLSKFEELMMRLHTIEEEIWKKQPEGLRKSYSPVCFKPKRDWGDSVFNHSFSSNTEHKNSDYNSWPINRSIDLVTDYSKGNFTAEIPKKHWNTERFSLPSVIWRLS